MPALRDLYPPIDPYSTGFLEVDDHHTLYWEQSGNPNGVPIVFLHGGPGGGTTPKHRQYFDPLHYRIILFDQRGAGKSYPHGDITHNTIDYLVDDLERLRLHLGITHWHLFGGSWGSTLALSYAISFPQHCRSLILRGIFLMEQADLDWFLGGISKIYPDAWDRFVSFLPPDERETVLLSYHARLMDPDPARHMPAAFSWMQFEGACAHFMPMEMIPPSPEDAPHAYALARMEAHYFMQGPFTGKRNILAHIDRIRAIPGTIIHGRYDAVCPLETAYRLHKAWPEADYIVVPDGGHAGSDPAIRHRLIEATDHARRL